MEAKLLNLMSWRAGLLLSGCFDALANENLFPYAVYCGDRLMPLTTRLVMLAALEALHLRLTAVGARRLQPQITTLGLGWLIPGVDNAAHLGGLGSDAAGRIAAGGGADGGVSARHRRGAARRDDGIHLPAPAGCLSVRLWSVRRATFLQPKVQDAQA